MLTGEFWGNASLHAHLEREPEAYAPLADETALALRDALWDSAMPIALFDADLRFLRGNEAVAAIHGLPAEALRGHRLSEIAPAEARAEVARIEERMRLVLDTGRAASLRIDLSLEGLPSHWRATYFPVRSSDGAARGVCAVISDVTRERQREADIQRARSDAERSAARVALLQRATAAFSSARSAGEVARAASIHVGIALGASAAAVWRVARDGRIELLAEEGAAGPALDGFALDARLPICDAVRRNAAVWLESPEAIEEHYPAMVPLVRGRGGAAVSVPLAAGGRVLGVLESLFPEARTFDLEERAFVLAIAEQAAQALDRALLREDERRLADEARTARDRLARLQGLTAALSKARSAAEVAAAIVAETTAAFDVRAVVVFLRRPGEDVLVHAASAGIPEETIRRLERVPLGALLVSATVARTGEPVWLEDRAPWTPPGHAFEISPPPGIEAVAAIPLRAGGRVLGVVALGFGAPRRFLPEQREVMESAAGLCAQALERAILYDHEAELRREAERARAVLDAIFDNAPVGIALVDRDLRFVRVNPLLAEMNGVPVDAHPGKTPRELLPDMPVDAVEAVWREILATGRPVLDVEVSGETPAAPGALRHWQESWYPVRAGAEEIGIGIIVREITAEREAQAFQRNVLGIVGHDLRNPLAAITTSAHAVRRLKDVAPDADRLAARILGNAARAERILSILLDYARVHGGQQVPINRRPCDLGAICRFVAEECEAARPGRRVVAGCTCRDPIGRWDPDRIGQVVANLLSNALDHGTPDAPVEIRCRDERDEVLLEVSNEGPPIPVEALPRLFEPFQRDDLARAKGREGLGLGLFIARAIVTAHGGHIDVRSAPGERTVFTVRLPRDG